MPELTIRDTTRKKHLLEWSQRVANCRSSGLSVSRWCTENNIKPKTYYAWQKKVFAAMIEQQKEQMMGPDPWFAELPPPVAEPARDKIPVASIRVRETTLDVYEGASPEIVTALCEILSHAE